MRQKAGKTVWVSSSGLSVNWMQKYKFKRAAVYIENEDSITPSPESITVSTPLIQSRMFILDKVCSIFEK